MPRTPRTLAHNRRYDPLAVLQHIHCYQEQHRGRSPSQRMIQAALEISAPSVVHNLLHRMERQGLLTITSYGRGRTGDLMLTEAGHTVIADAARRSKRR